MDQHQDIPLLFSFYFGDSATSAQRSASLRFKKWSRAFEEWIKVRRRDYQYDTVKQTLIAWRRLARQCGKMPWEIGDEDIRQHVTWMKEEGLAASTINSSISIINNFYRWSNENGVDKACPAGFNPANAAVRMSIRRFAGACMWSREETEALLELLKRDESLLGKREYAFFLAWRCWGCH